MEKLEELCRDALNDTSKAVSWYKKANSVIRAVKQLEAGNKRLKRAIEEFGNNPAGFDWAVLEKLEKLEKALANIADSSIDENPPYRIMGAEQMKEVAQQALKGK